MKGTGLDRPRRSSSSKAHPTGFRPDSQVTEARKGNTDRIFESTCASMRKMQEIVIIMKVRLNRSIGFAKGLDEK